MFLQSATCGISHYHYCLSATFHIRRWRRVMAALLKANKPDSSLSHTTGHLEGDLETFPDVFVATKCFHSNQVFFVPKNIRTWNLINIWLTATLISNNNCCSSLKTDQQWNQEIRKEVEAGGCSPQWRRCDGGICMAFILHQLRHTSLLWQNLRGHLTAAEDEWVHLNITQTHRLRYTSIAEEHAVQIGLTVCL